MNSDFNVSRECPSILLIGGGRGGVQIMDALRDRDGSVLGDVVGFMDDDPAALLLKDYNIPHYGPVSVDFAKGHQGRLFDAVVCSVSTSIKFRKRVFDEFSEAGIYFANVIHPTAWIGMNAHLGSGNIILAHCQIGSETIVGDNNFITAGCNIEHHCEVGSHNTFGPAVVTSSRCRIGNCVRLGTGIFMEPAVVIGNGCMIGSHNVFIYGESVDEMSVVKTRADKTIRKLPGSA